MLTPAAYEDRQSLLGRLVAVRVVCIIAMVMLATCFWFIQVLQHGKFDTIAQSNHLRTLPLRAPRGILFDRTGRILVDNRRAWSIAIVREKTTNLPRAIELLARVADLDVEEVKAIVERHRREPMFRPITIVEHASFEQVAAVTARSIELPEVIVQEVPTRSYPPGRMAAHLFGYVGEIQPTQLGQSGFEAVEAGAIVGQTGLERTYNGQLQGVDGSKVIVVNSIGREIEMVREDEPTEGHRLQLTIDYDLQRALEDGFESLGFDGAGAVLDPNTGEVLAMTSRPSYDPNVFASGIDSKTYQALATDPRKPLFNKLIKGRYPPGSVFKIVMSIAALSEGIINPDHTEYCNGLTTVYGHPRQCLGRHGRVDLRTALEKSCNIYFYRLGERLDIDVIHRYAEQLGLHGVSGIDLPGEEDGFVGSREWKKKLNGQQWFPGDTISVAIGQGYVGVTPIGLATMIASVANGGTRVTPHLVRAEDRGQGWQPVPAPPSQGRLDLKPDVMNTIREALGRVVESGTAIRGRIAGVPYAGKTGTAQANISLANRRALGNRYETRDHGFFVFFAPLDKPQLAGVIFGEHAEHGSWTSPIAKHVIETYLAKRDGRPLPVLPMKAVVNADP
ncbi:MAG TPA: penicillin-binding protein 2, partial [Vicinamibacterales bacterium]|nr:penicillin-binding protein 2 [Vicinamibacterales bacterium]